MKLSKKRNKNISKVFFVLLIVFIIMIFIIIVFSISIKKPEVEEEKGILYSLFASPIQGLSKIFSTVKYYIVGTVTPGQISDTCDPNDVNFLIHTDIYGTKRINCREQNPNNPCSKCVENEDGSGSCKEDKKGLVICKTIGEKSATFQTCTDNVGNYEFRLKDCPVSDPKKLCEGCAFLSDGNGNQIGDASCGEGIKEDGKKFCRESERLVVTCKASYSPTGFTDLVLERCAETRGTGRCNDKFGSCYTPALGDSYCIAPIEKFFCSGDILKNSCVIMDALGNVVNTIGDKLGPDVDCSSLSIYNDECNQGICEKSGSGNIAQCIKNKRLDTSLCTKDPNNECDTGAKCEDVKGDYKCVHIYTAEGEPCNTNYKKNRDEVCLDSYACQPIYKDPDPTKSSKTIKCLPKYKSTETICTSNVCVKGANVACDGKSPYCPTDPADIFVGRNCLIPNIKEDPCIAYKCSGFGTCTEPYLNKNCECSQDTAINFGCESGEICSEKCSCVSESPSTSSSGGSTSNYASSIKITETQLASGKQVTLGSLDSATVSVSGVSHKITATTKTSKTALITLASTPKTKILSIGEEWKVDNNEDNYLDLLIKLENITNNKSIISIKSINEKIVLEINNSENNLTESTTPFVTAEKQRDSQENPLKNTEIIKSLILFSIILIILIVFVFYFFKIRRKTNIRIRKK